MPDHSTPSSLTTRPTSAPLAAFIALALGAALALALVPQPAAQAAGFSTISGTLTVRGGGSAGGLLVQAIDARSLAVNMPTVDSETTSAADGTFTVTGLDLQNYYIRVEDRSHRIATQYFPSSITLGGSTPVKITEIGEAVTGINLTLDVGGEISGTVSAPPFNAAGSLMQATRFNSATSTWEAMPSIALHYDRNFQTLKADGRYRFTALPPGTYRISAGGVSGYVGAFYPGEGEPIGTVEVVAGAVLSGLDYSLGTGAELSGQLTLPAVTGVTFLADLVTRSGDRILTQQSATVEADGSYRIRQVPAGTYKLRFSVAPRRVSFWGTVVTPAPSVTMPEEYYDNVGTYELAKDIVVAPNAVLTGYDATITVEGPPKATSPADPAPSVGAKKITRVIAPKVTGKAKVGTTLRATSGTWKPGRVTIKRQWFVKSGSKATKIPRATSARLKVTKKWAGKKVRLRITVSAPGHATAVHTTAWSKKIKR